MGNNTEHSSGNDAPEKSIGSSIKEFAEDIFRDLLGALEDLVAPPPKLIPIPVRSRHYPQPRRRR